MFALPQDKIVNYTLIMKTDIFIIDTCSPLYASNLALFIYLRDSTGSGCSKHASFFQNYHKVNVYMYQPNAYVYVNYLIQ